uniref:Uncharacterized protein n=1 Tax=Schistosoma haematobium TaxID=6185 RepID=A0A095A0U1_SCHHA
MHYTSDQDNFTNQSRSTLGTQPSISANNSGRNGLSSDSTNSGPDEDKYDDSKKVLTERRRMQLEKIRAMAAELKPSRGRSRGNGRGIRSGAVSRGSLKPRGRCRILRTEGYREQNSINHIMGILIEHSDSLFRMIAPSCENVTTLNDNLSDKNYTQIQAVRNKKYDDKFG